VYRLRMNRCMQAEAVTDDTQELFHAGAASPRGVTMRDCSKNRAGFDRVLMAVAATFLTVSASSVLAQADPARSAAELAIDAAIPRPEPANLPPPTINDFKLDTTATVPDAAKTRPSDIVTAPAADTRRTTRRPPRRRRRRPRLPQRHQPNPRRNQPRLRAASRRQISRSPTNCAKRWAPNRCAISTVRPNAPRWRSFTPHANSRRCGLRPAL